LTFVHHKPIPARSVTRVLAKRDLKTWQKPTENGAEEQKQICRHKHNCTALRLTHICQMCRWQCKGIVHCIVTVSEPDQNESVCCRNWVILL